MWKILNKILKMNFRKIIKDKFNIELSIREGNGTTIENPIVIDHTQYIRVEKDCINDACKILHMKWVIYKQELIEYMGKSIDVITIRISKNGDFENNYKQTYFYFDISEIIKKSAASAKVYREW